MFSKDSPYKWKYATLLNQAGELFLVVFDPCQVDEYDSVKNASSTPASALAKLDKSRGGLLFVAMGLGAGSEMAIAESAII